MQRTNSDVYCRMLIEQANGGPEMPGVQPQLPVTPLYDTRSDRILSSETEEVLQLELASYIKSAASQRANSSAFRTQDKRLWQPGARVVQEELENGQIAIVEDELRDQGDRIHRCVVISLVKYAVIALTKYGVFTTLTLHSTGYKYAVIALTKYGVFTTLTLHSTPCLMNELDCSLAVGASSIRKFHKES
ncbi:hypothetical protein PF008_g9014 [Phytophthora fragariae]|uniref:Uncharacterized protein n=2 Tax=Phytophthora fragariae TaxID=53985 RepID=A0A6G0RZG8_9STRA|nr:hypothetical protein PF008_g9014 [Phytophthora fragariae]